jgi:hypothetical protein
MGIKGSEMTNDKSNGHDETSQQPHVDDEFMAGYRADAERGDAEAQYQLSQGYLINFASFEF